MLALGYWLYQFAVTNYDNFGIQFRYLTIWGLTGALIVTWLLYSNLKKRQKEHYFPLVSAVAVLNAMVVFLYWKLYFIDPSLVNYSGKIIWHQEYYLHVLGPLLLIVDALFINNAFFQIKRGILITLTICITYIVWFELVTGPLNSKPEGKITNGLPYPFLNNMAFMERSAFYFSTIVTGLLFYFFAWVITKIKMRFLPAK